jgi:hypothetical protein
MNDYQKIVETETGCHVELDRVQLQRDYVERLIDGMDIDTLCTIVAEYMEMNLSDYTDEQLIAEVNEYYPDMLDNDEE